MKKKYLQPTTKLTITNVRTSLLTGSQKNLGGDRGAYTGGQLSREGGMWYDDDDIEDY